MTDKEFNLVIEEQLGLCVDLLCKKGKEYDRETGDRFHSFKVAAALQGETPIQALAGMLAKHTVSVYDLIKEGNTNIDLWNEKITDHINYLLLLKGLVIDNAKEVH